jgi:hypothetical protein
MHENEGRGIRPGAPKSQEQGRGQGESKEGQALPNVWDYLERRVTLKDRLKGYEYERERIELMRLEDVIERTERDGLILCLYDSIRHTLGRREQDDRYRRLSLEEFQQFRSKVEPMSDEELTKELEKQEDEFNKRLDERSCENPPRKSTTFPSIANFQPAGVLTPDPDDDFL